MQIRPLPSLSRRYRGPALEGSSVEGPEEGGSATATGSTKETKSISSSLLEGERVMLGGIADPPPSVVEKLAVATGAQVRMRRVYIGLGVSGSFDATTRFEQT